MAKIEDIIKKQPKQKGLKETITRVDNSRKTESIQTTVSPEIKIALTKKRGYQPEASYIRHLILKDLGFSID